jgi:hypothetical protein
LAWGWWLVLVCSERRVLLAGCWFVMREKYCWLVADKPSEQAEQAMKSCTETDCRGGRLTLL